MLSRRVLVEHHGIVEGCAEREASAPQPRHVVHAAEGAGPRDVAAEAFWREIEGVALVADHLDWRSRSRLRRGTRRRTDGARRTQSPILTCTGFSTWMKRRTGGLGHDAGLVDGGDEAPQRCRP